MHYVLVISSLTSGGAERILSQLANYWVEQGHQISLLLFKGDEMFYLLDRRVEVVSLSRAPNRWLKWPYFFLKALELRAYVKRLKPDVVLSFLDKVNLITLLMTVGLPTPIVVSERVDPHHHHIGRVLDIWRRWLYKRAQCVVVQTQSIARYFQVSTVIIPNFVLPIKKKTEIRKEVKRVVNVGRLDAQKDQKTLIYAFYNLIQGGYTSMSLHIYGQGPLKRELQNLINELRMESYIFLKGAVPNVHEEIRDSDLFVFPSLYEGFPNALCEALAVGLPCIASDVSGSRDVIEDGVNGRLFQVGNILELTSVMKELIDSAEQRQKLAELAPRSMESYKPENIYPLWDKLMKDASIA